MLKYFQRNTNQKPFLIINDLQRIDQPAYRVTVVGNPVFGLGQQIA